MLRYMQRHSNACKVMARYRRSVRSMYILLGENKLLSNSIILIYMLENDELDA